MNVQPTNERYVYEAGSETEARTYRVDLLANDGAGCCSCTDFSARRQPALRNGAVPLTDACVCKHLRAAHTHFLRGILKALAAEENNGP